MIFLVIKNDLRIVTDGTAILFGWEQYFR
jgi:hypothetical protein